MASACGVDPGGDRLDLSSATIAVRRSGWPGAPGTRPWDGLLPLMHACSGADGRSRRRDMQQANEKTQRENNAGMGKEGKRRLWLCHPAASWGEPRHKEGVDGRSIVHPGIHHHPYWLRYESPRGPTALGRSQVPVRDSTLDRAKFRTSYPRSEGKGPETLM